MCSSRVSGVFSSRYVASGSLQETAGRRQSTRTFTHPAPDNRARQPPRSPGPGVEGAFTSFGVGSGGGQRVWFWVGRRGFGPVSLPPCVGMFWPNAPAPPLIGRDLPKRLEWKEMAPCTTRVPFDINYDDISIPAITTSTSKRSPHTHTRARARAGRCVTAGDPPARAAPQAAQVAKPKPPHAQ